MEVTDFLTQFLQYLLGVLPGDVAANVIAVITTVVTICTLIIRFWKEPDQASKFYKLWKLLHVMASFKKADTVKEKESNANKTS